MPADSQKVTSELTKEAVVSLRSGMEKIEHCLGQLNDRQVWWRPEEQMNAIGNLLLHLAGNLQQWIVAGMGDAEDTRDRPSEFSQRTEIAQGNLLEHLQGVVGLACETLSNQSPDELLQVKRIQQWQLSKMHAMMNSVAHFQGHVQEIVCLTRQQLGEQYRFEWTPGTAEE